MEHEALAMVFALHKFKHDLLGNKFVFYLDHMALVHLMNKPQVSSCIARWLFLFFEYEFIVVYKLGHSQYDLFLHNSWHRYAHFFTCIL
jgi:hypothetical protein